MGSKANPENFINITAKTRTKENERLQTPTFEK